MLKVKPPKAEAMSKISFKLPESTVDLLKKYQEACLKDYGTETSSDYIVNEILISFFTSDKKFQQFLKENKAQKLEKPAEKTKAS